MSDRPPIFALILTAWSIALSPSAFAAPAPDPAPAPAAVSPPKPGPIVFVAASLKPALEPIAAAWQAQTGKAPLLTYGTSDALAKDIEKGTAADLFISADGAAIEYAEKHQLLKVETRRRILSNELVLIEPAETTVSLKITRGLDLTSEIGDGKLAVCVPETCADGPYAKEALEWMGAWQGLAGKLVPKEGTDAIGMVARGEAKLGIVYATDAKAEPKVKTVDTFPSASHSPIFYTAALVTKSKNADAGLFFSYLRSQAATKLFREYGFAIR
jgi:molybdate transport system substrate-binding protein